MSIHPEQHPLDGKLEPETKDCFNDRAPLYSIAISLKRIADAPSEAAARITELEGDLKAAFREISKLAREAGEAKGRLEMSEAAGIVEGWRERAERAEARCRALESASPAEPSGWRPIESAPKDGTPFIGLGPVPRDGDTEARETRWQFYGEGSLMKAAFDRGEGPSGQWRWSEPIHNWASGWKPTHWMPLPLPPTSEGGGA